MEVIVTSRQMKASTVLDMAFDLGMDRPRIATVEEWNGAQAYILTFGPAAYRKTAILRPSMTQEKVTETLALAKAEEIPKSTLAQAPADTGWTKPDTEINDTIRVVSGPVSSGSAGSSKPQKRKAAKSRASST